MGTELTRAVGKYWVLYFQPLPEAGERIAIALVFDDCDGVARVEYDPHLSKVIRMFPDADPQGLVFCLDRLGADLRTAKSVEQTLHTYGPQFAVSEARRIALPLATGTVQVLKNRYLYSPKREPKKRVRKDPVAQEIEAFVRLALDANTEMRTNVAARDLLGHPIAGTKRVALAIPIERGWALIDGVDLNQLTAKQAADRANDISRTFWNYGRAASQDAVQIRRVGVVLNGHSHLDPQTHEAHDYALHRFRAESDLAIDAASDESGSQLRHLLENVT
jgi:hypothetical protein